MFSHLRWSFRVFPGCQDSYDLSEFHNGLDDFKVALYVCSNHTDSSIHSQLEIVTFTTLKNPETPP